MKPNNKVLNFFDLDGVLWESKTKIWVIDKEDPSKPIIRLTSMEMTDILLGVHFKDKLKIEYNQKTYYISNKLFNKIRKKKNIAIERLGLSYIEYTNPTYLNNTKIEIILDNIRHLKPENNLFCILTGRAYQHRHSKMLNFLREKLLDININLFKIYFVGKRVTIEHTEQISLDKAHVLLEHLIGVKIEDGKFVSKKQDWYSDIHFYDDNQMNIDYAIDIQTIFERVMKKTEDELYITILTRLKDNELSLTAHLVTNNDVNRFKSKTVTLTEPVRFPIK